MKRGGFIVVFLCTLLTSAYSQDTLILQNKKGVQVRLDTDRFIGLYTEKPDSNLNLIKKSKVLRYDSTFFLTRMYLETDSIEQEVGYDQVKHFYYCTKESDKKCVRSKKQKAAWIIPTVVTSLTGAVLAFTVDPRIGIPILVAGPLYMATVRQFDKTKKYSLKKWQVVGYIHY